MKTSFLERFFVSESPIGWEAARLCGDDLSKLLDQLLFSDKESGKRNACLFHSPSDFPAPWSKFPRERPTGKPCLFIFRPDGKPPEIESVRSSFHFDGLFLVVAKEGTTVALLAKRCPPCPSLFRLSDEVFRMLTCTDADELKSFFEKIKTSLGAKGREFLEKFQPTRKSPPIFLQIFSLFFGDKSERNLGSEIRAHIRNCLAETMPIELEGEPLFLALNRFFRTFLNYDYLELQVPEPDDFWPGRGPDWTWRDMEWTGAMPSVHLRIERFADKIRDSEPVVIGNIASTEYLVHSPRYKAMKLKSGVLIPLPLRGRSSGWLKLLFRQELVPSKEDMALLRFLSGAVADVLIRSRLYLRTQRMATIDGLTGLFNHRFFREQLRKEFQRARRYRSRLALIMVDVDDFKQYNDTNGHLAGDQALATLASTIKRTVRDIDFVARYGGEEFALILPEVDARGGLIVAEKLRRAVESKSFEGEQRLRGKKITISCGISSNAMAHSAEEMIESADRALYWVKRHGRNRCRLAQRIKDVKNA
jgi:diguanylate cyclase (GGDEF)-like protein